MENTEGFVYVIRFSEPLGNPDKPRGMARTYIGHAFNVEGRFHFHLAGKGAKITAAAAERGIGMEIVAIIPGGYDLEQKIKAQKNTAKYLARHYGIII